MHPGAELNFRNLHTVSITKMESHFCKHKCYQFHRTKIKTDNTLA
jgi:hypothetical protein